MTGSPDIVTILLSIGVPAGAFVSGIFGWILKDYLASIRKSLDEHAKDMAGIHVKLNEHDVSLARHTEARIGSEKDLDQMRDDMRDLKVGVTKLGEQMATLVALMKAGSKNQRGESA